MNQLLALSLTLFLINTSFGNAPADTTQEKEKVPLAAATAGSVYCINNTTIKLKPGFSKETEDCLSAMATPLAQDGVAVYCIQTKDETQLLKRLESSSLEMTRFPLSTTRANTSVEISSTKTHDGPPKHTLGTILKYNVNPINKEINTLDLQYTYTSASPSGVKTNKGKDVPTISQTSITTSFPTKPDFSTVLLKHCEGGDVVIIIQVIQVHIYPPLP